MVALRSLLLVLAFTSLALGAADRPASDFNDSELADLALAAIGAEVPGTTRKCAGCHTMNEDTISTFAYRKGFTDSCLAGWIQNPNKKTAESTLRCIASETDPKFRWEASKLGLWTGRAESQIFEDIFNTYFGETGAAELQRFRRAVNMPRSGMGNFNDREWELISEYVGRGTPLLKQKLAPIPAEIGCRQFTSPELLTYLKSRETQSWKTLNQSHSMLMWGCAKVNDPKSCFTKKSGDTEMFPDVTLNPETAHWNFNSKVQTIRMIVQYRQDTSFWSRASPDGRFISTGVSGGFEKDDSSYSSAVIDLDPLLKNKPYREIGVSADYDPGYFPDGSAFIFQSPNMICPISLLKDPATKAVTSDMCAPGGMDLYHSQGAGLNGGDYLAVSAAFRADDGSGSSEPYWGHETDVDFFPFIYDGTVFQQQKRYSVSFPYQGDVILSPSTGLMVTTRAYLANNKSEVMKGNYDVQFLERTGDVEKPIKPSLVARICLNGGKPTFSFDERFMVYHRYVTPEDFSELGFATAEDPVFKERVTNAVANIYIFDLKAMRSYRLTNMGTNERALFPSFRSDGWIYFQINNTEKVGRTYVASDAALRLMGVTK